MKPEWRVYISWAELRRNGDRAERVHFGTVYTADTLDDAKVLFGRARLENGWLDANVAFDIQIDVRGPGVFMGYQPDRAKTAAGLASVRAALDKCHGPLMDEDRRQGAVA